MAILVLLGTLGVAIGATTLDPAGESPSPEAFGIGAGIWWLLSGILALFAGGWAAGRLAGLRRQLEGPLHGVVTWALTAVVSALLMTSVVGMLISGAFRVVGATVSTAASGTRALASQVEAPQTDVAWNQVWTEAQQVLRQTETPALQPENLRAEAEGAAEQAQTADLESALARLRSGASDVASAADKDAAVNVLVARTDMSEAEARRTVEGWSQRLQSARDTAGSVAGDARDAAVGAADATMDAVAGAAWWTFVYLLLTALAAGLGGFLGAPRARRGDHGGTTKASGGESRTKTSGGESRSATSGTATRTGTPATTTTGSATGTSARTTTRPDQA